MLANVVEVNENEVVIEVETGDNIYIKNTHDDFEALKAFYDSDSYFEFDPEIEKIIDIDIDVIDTEDYSLPEDFY